MIYKKDANFPYPILTNTSNAYNNAKFHLVIGLDEIGNDYCFEPQYDISSEFKIPNTKRKCKFNTCCIK